MIKITESTNDNAFLKRKKKTIAKKFSLTQSKTIEEANLLCAYLLSTNREKEAYDILKSYAEHIPFDEHRWPRWVATCQAILLLSHIERSTGTHKEITRLNNIVLKQDYYQFLRSGDKTEYFHELIEGYHSIPRLLESCDIGHNETCIIYAESLIYLMYFDQFHQSIETFTNKDVEILQSAINELKRTLSAYITKQ